MDALLIITSTSDELFGGTYIVDLKRPWNLESGFYFFAILNYIAHFNGKLHQN